MAASKLARRVLILCTVSLAAVLPTQTQESPGFWLFVENVGQYPAGVRYQSLGVSGALTAGEDAIWIDLPVSPEGADSSVAEKADSTIGVRLRFSFPHSGGSTRLEASDRSTTRVSFFKGGDPADWHPDVPVWGRLRYRNLAPGVDLELGGTRGEPLWRWIIGENADPAELRLRIEGAESVRLENGQAVLETATGTLRLRLPAMSGPGISLDPEVVPAGDARFEILRPFSAAAEPAVMNHEALNGQLDLLYSTFMGGGPIDWCQGIKVDASGVAYVVGNYHGSGFSFGTPGAYDTTYNGDRDVFIAKMNAGGTAFIYATFLGGPDPDTGYGIAIDSSGAAYVTGTTGQGFPTTAGAWRPANADLAADAFVAKLNPAGTGLVYSTLLGGLNWDQGLGITVDKSNLAYVLGITTGGGFPARSLKPDGSLDGFFVAKVNGSGSALEYSVTLAGYRSVIPGGIAVNDIGQAYVATHTGYPGTAAVTAGAIDSTWNGGNDAYVAKLNATGSGLVFGTYLGGTGRDEATGIAIDGSGAAYVVGTTDSSDFPTTAGYDRTHNGGSDVFVAKISPGGTSLLYSTYLGGGKEDIGNGIDVDTRGMAYVTGRTEGAGFPTTVNAYDSQFHGGVDVFVTKIDPGGLTLNYSTLLGGPGWDEGKGTAAGLVDTVFVAGYVDGAAGFPTTPGSLSTTRAGTSDGFVARLATTGFVTTTTTQTSTTTTRPSTTLATTTTTVTTSASTSTTTSTVPVSTTIRPTTTTTITATTTSTTTTTLPLPGPYEMIFPHYAFGGDYWSYLTLVNPTAGLVGLQIELFDQAGRPVPLRTSDGSLVGPYSLPARSTANLTFGGATQVAVGWCRVRSAAPLGGSLMYQLRRGFETLSEAAVLPSARMKRFVLPVPQLGGLAATALAIANPDSQPVTYTFRFYNEAGALWGQDSRQLAAGQQTAIYASQLLPQLPLNVAGHLEFEVSGSGAAAVGLHFEGNVFSTLPVIILP